MFGSIESNQAEYIVLVLKPKKLSMIPSPLFLKTPTNKSTEPES